jgi:hypothetical protein
VAHGFPPVSHPYSEAARQHRMKITNSTNAGLGLYGLLRGEGAELM